MEKTPVLKSKLSKFQNHKAQRDSRNVSLDTNNKSGSFTRNDGNIVFDIDNEESPVQIACTQDGSENIDVVWDWNSPQAKKQQRKCQKRLLLPQSPKIPLKKFPSNNSIQHFEKLREELQALRKEIALPENEDSLRLSPREEADYKNIHSPVNPSLEFNNDCINDMFDEQLIEYSEQSEDKFSPNDKTYKFQKSHETTHAVNSVKQKISFKKTKNESHVKKANDSFEELLGEIDIETFTSPFSEEDCIKANGKSDSLEPRPVISSDYFSQRNFLKSDAFETRSSINHTNSGKVEFHRTQSFELSNFEHSGENLPKNKLDEIEKKRSEARAKLEMKRKHDQTISFSQSQCSMKEIENKRLQALAKLEAKRQQDIIERKRQEALKRLQTNRQKNAMIVKSSLTQRLD